jgi:hypothetical protein
MKKVSAKIYGSKGWIVISDGGDLLGFVWKPGASSSYAFRYETFGVYSESGFGNSLKDCLSYIESAKNEPD